jgi:serine acetyltransferase
MKAWRTKYVDWGPNPTPPHISPQGHHITFRPRKERDKFQHVLESLIRIAKQCQVATAATTSYGLCLGHINTC